jgi:predicted DNA-binding protein YlxM (UPF0122 family)
MIGFFPEFYPDELLYSACARYANQVIYPNKQTAVIDLFGSRGLSAIVDFPTRIENLLSSIPNHNYTSDKIIDKQTLFPFYEPFISDKRAEVIRNEMKASGENRIRTRLATNIKQVKTSKFLRYCPICTTDDRKTFGEAYWHRVHQLAGILVCSKHGCLLENSAILWERESSAFFHLAEAYLPQQKPPRFLTDKNTGYQTILYLAEKAEWLLVQTNLPLKPGELRQRYYNLLLERGFAYYNGRIRNNKLLEEFNNFFPKSVLAELGCETESGGRNWVLKFFEIGRSDVFNHPIRHLLILKFLNADVNSLFKYFVEYKPFVESPYPCLNRVSPHYKELRIQNCRVVDNLTKGKNRAKPLGIFTCDCGFIYQRVGPDKSEKDRFLYGSVSEYGLVWEAELGKYWANLDLSLVEIAKKFGTSTHLISRHAIRLKLPMNSAGTRSLQGYVRHLNPRKYFSRYLKQHREEWIELIKKYPNANRKFLLQQNYFVYSWLKKNDSEWFEKHLPLPLKVLKRKDYLDWQKVDNELSEKVEKACREIKAQKQPLRICITEIIRRTGNKNRFEGKLSKLPKTKRILEKNLESLEDFMVRKTIWASNIFIEEKVVPTRNQLEIRASIRNSTSQNSALVQKTVDASLIKIAKEVDS